MTKVKFSASGLQDIADHFHKLADYHADAASVAKTIKAKRAHMGAATTWNSAAQFLDQCEIVPAPPVAS